MINEILMNAYRVKITVEGSNPPVWRQMTVPEAITFHQLHQIIEVAFELEDIRSYKFVCDGAEISDMMEIMDSHITEGKQFLYIYEGEMNLAFQIEVESILEDCAFRYPKILEAKGECAQKKKPDFECFDLIEINNQLRNGLVLPLPENKKQHLDDLLESYSIDELIYLAKKNHVSDYSNYTKSKEELVHHLAEEMLKPDCVRDCFLYLHDDEIKVFERARHYAGQPCEESAFEFTVLLRYGYVNMTVFGDVVIPEELYDMYQQFSCDEFHEKRRRITKIADYCNGLTELYGVTEMDQVKKVFDTYEEEKLKSGEVRKFMSPRFAEHCKFEIIGTLLVDKVMVREGYYQKLYANQGNKPYYFPTKEEIMTLANYTIEEVPQPLEEFYAFLINCKSARDGDAITICWKTGKYISWGAGIQEIMDLCERYDIILNDVEEEYIEFVHLVEEAGENIRLVENRGHTQREMKAYYDEHKEDSFYVVPGRKKSGKIYPNEECPCGSGKKYKHCCGK